MGFLLWMAGSGGGTPALLLETFVVADDFTDDEVQEFPGELRVEVGLFGQALQPFDLPGFARRVRRRKGVFGLELAHGLGALEPFGQREDKDRVQPVDRGAVFQQKAGGSGRGVHQSAPPVCVSLRDSPAMAWRNSIAPSSSPSAAAPSRCASRAERALPAAT